MAKIKIELNDAGVQSLLKGQKMQEILAVHAAAKAQQAGAGYDSAVHVFSKRAVANIFPDTEEAAQDNYNNNTLLKVVP